MHILGCHKSVAVFSKMAVALGMPLEHRVLLYDARPKYLVTRNFVVDADGGLLLCQLQAR